MSFVLDTSVAMRWLLPDPDPQRQHYALTVLSRLAHEEAQVPRLFWLEAANVISRAQSRGALEGAQVERFMAALGALPIAEQGAGGHALFKSCAMTATTFVSGQPSHLAEVA